MDKSFVLLTFKVGSLAIFTVLLLMASNLLLLLGSKIEHFSSQQTSVQISSPLSRINQTYFGLMAMFFISTLGGLLAAISPGYLVVITFYIILALAGTNKNYIVLTWLLSLGWYVEIGGISKVLSWQFLLFIFLLIVLSCTRLLIFLLGGINLVFSKILNLIESPSSNIQNEPINQKNQFYLQIQKSSIVIFITLTMINCFFELRLLEEIAAFFDITVMNIIGFWLHPSILAQGFLIGKQITINQLINSREKVAAFFLPISITAIGLSLGWGLGVKTFISH